jgi:hypothetical protein
MTYDDLPIIRIPPAPTDAELQAERDTKYAALLAQEHADGEWDDHLSTPKET